MIEKLQGAAQVRTATANAKRNASNGVSPAFGAMLQQRVEQRDAARTQALQGSASIPQSGVSATRTGRSGFAPTQAAQGNAFQTQIPQSGVSAVSRQTVNFSKHALARAEERGIELTPDLMGKLADSVEKAQEKGAKNILAFSDSQAFIVNIPYGRVITAMSGDEMRENIFTNIDGAVLL